MVECPHNAYGACYRCMDAHIAKLQAFKDYVHKRLDDAGIPTHPGGHHSKAGCRIGDRLDIVLLASHACDARSADEVCEEDRPTLGPNLGLRGG